LNKEKEGHLGQYFNIKGKNAEETVHTLAENTFLLDWCYLNPKLPDGKELCDLLIVYDDTAIIWQIKDLRLDENNRYKKEEVEKNLRQLSGARRQMFDLKTNITLTNPRRGNELFHPSNIKNIFLISVLFGEGEDYLSPAENIKGYTAHIFTKDFTQIILEELDTIYDFVGYLKAKEELLKTKKGFIIGGGEEELLAAYLLENRSFSQFDGHDFIVIDPGCWKMFQEKVEYKARKAEDKISYLWDGIINRAHEGGEGYEKIAVELARSGRFERRCLSKSFYDARLRADKDEGHDQLRRMTSINGTTYCFLLMDDPEPRENRKLMLEAICLVARGQQSQNKKVLGIATEKKMRPLCSYDFCLLHIPEWNDEYQKKANELKEKAGIFKNIIERPFHEDEYPFR
jgi:hypothetical protein